MVAFPSQARAGTPAIRLLQHIWCIAAERRPKSALMGAKSAKNAWLTRLCCSFVAVMLQHLPQQFVQHIAQQKRLSVGTTAALAAALSGQSSRLRLCTRSFGKSGFRPGFNAGAGFFRIMR
jgi:hypothetical protein